MQFLTGHVSHLFTGEKIRLGREMELVDGALYVVRIQIADSLLVETGQISGLLRSATQTAIEDRKSHQLQKHSEVILIDTLSTHSDSNHQHYVSSGFKRTIFLHFCYTFVEIGLF